MPTRRQTLSLLAMPALHGASLAAAAAPAAAAPVLSIVATEFPPYTTMERADGGPAAAITRAALARGGLDMRLEFRPWSRLLVELHRGLWDGVIGVWHSQQRESFLAFPQPLGIANRIGFMARVASPHEVKDLSRLGGLRIGVVRGYANPPAFVQAALQLDEALDDLGNLRKLLAGRIDLALVDKGVAAHLLRKQLKSEARALVWLEPSVDELPLYTAFARSRAGHESRLAAFNKGMSELQSSGQLARLLQNDAELL